MAARFKNADHEARVIGGAKARNPHRRSIPMGANTAIKTAIRRTAWFL